MSQPESESPLSTRTSHFSICGMCAVRCPIEVQVQDGKVCWLQGNPNDDGMATSLCPKGAAGVVFQSDDERPQKPLIRAGARGEGNWREVSWDEALDYVIERLSSVKTKLGAKGILLSDRGGPFNDLTKSFMKAIGSPNYFDHDSSCAANVHHATKSLFGFGRSDLVYDYVNASHIVLFGRNILESLMVKEVKAFLKARDNGAKVTYIDPRFTITASRADRYWQIRPNSDYALNLAIIHELLDKELYDKAFVETWVTGLDNLRAAVTDTTPDWAEQRTGIPADEIRAFVREIAGAAPKVIFHAGWMTARHGQSFYVSRTAHVINTLLGSIGQPGGLLLAKGVTTPTGRPLKKLVDRIPTPEAPRADGAGGVNRHWDPGIGVAPKFMEAIKTGIPYPIGAYIAYRHDPLTGFPDPTELKAVLNQLDLLVSIDVNFSETAWYADVILPESSYLERANILAEFKGASPYLAMRKAAVEPRFDSRPGWWIFTELAKRLGAGEHFPFDSIQDIWRYQLDGTGVDLSALETKGVLTLDDGVPRPLGFNTPSGRIEFASSLLSDAGFDAFPPFETKPKAEDSFFLLFGRVAQLSHGQSTNNVLLNELRPENALWIHSSAARRLGITNGGRVRVSNGGQTTEGKALVTDRIHPDAVFMLHGFGRGIPVLSRSYGKGLCDQKLQRGKLFDFDPVGGGFNYTETQVRVEAVETAGEAA